MCVCVCVQNGKIKKNRLAIRISPQKSQDFGRSSRVEKKTAPSFPLFFSVCPGPFVYPSAVLLEALCESRSTKSRLFSRASFFFFPLRHRRIYALRLKPSPRPRWKTFSDATQRGRRLGGRLGVRPFFFCAAVVATTGSNARLGFGFVARSEVGVRYSFFFRRRCRIEKEPTSADRADAENTKRFSLFHISRTAPRGKGKEKRKKKRDRWALAIVTRIVFPTFFFFAVLFGASTLFVARVFFARNRPLTYSAWPLVFGHCNVNVL